MVSLAGSNPARKRGVSQGRTAQRGKRPRSQPTRQEMDEVFADSGDDAAEDDGEDGDGDDSDSEPPVVHVCISEDCNNQVSDKGLRCGRCLCGAPGCKSGKDCKEHRCVCKKLSKKYDPDASEQERDHFDYTTACCQAHMCGWEGCGESTEKDVCTHHLVSTNGSRSRCLRGSLTVIVSCRWPKTCTISCCFL